MVVGARSWIVLTLASGVASYQLLPVVPRDAACRNLPALRVAAQSRTAMAPSMNMGERFFRLVKSNVNEVTQP